MVGDNKQEELIPRGKAKSQESRMVCECSCRYHVQA